MFAVLILYCFWCFSWQWYFFGQCTKSHWPQLASGTTLHVIYLPELPCSFIFASSVGLASPTALVTSLYCQLSTLSVKHSLFLQQLQKNGVAKELPPLCYPASCYYGEYHNHHCLSRDCTSSSGLTFYFHIITDKAIRVTYNDLLDFRVYKSFWNFSSRIG